MHQESRIGSWIVVVRNYNNMFKNQGPLSSEARRRSHAPPSPLMSYVNYFGSAFATEKKAGDNQIAVRRNVRWTYGTHHIQVCYISQPGMVLTVSLAIKPKGLEGSSFNKMLASVTSACNQQQEGDDIIPPCVLLCYCTRFTQPLR